MDIFNPDDQIIGYGDQTIKNLKNAVDKPLKVFWDGELDLKDSLGPKKLAREMFDSLVKRRAEVPTHKKKRKLTFIHGVEAREEMEKMSEIVKLEEKERLRKERGSCRR